MATSNHKGFTFIELLIILVIIAILAALAVPRFITASHRGDCKVLLTAVYEAEKTYYQKHGRYTPYVKDLALPPKVTKQIVNSEVLFTIRLIEPLGFEASVLKSGTRATIDQSGTLKFSIL